MQTVRTIGTIVRRNNLSGMQGIRQFVYLLLTTDTYTLTTSLYNVTGIKVHLLRF